jgi:hypothetical protein
VRDRRIPAGIAHGKAPSASANLGGVTAPRGRVDSMGGDSTAVLPSPAGEWHGDHAGHGGHHDGERLVCTVGKVAGIVHDHFGDFAGFLMETEEGGLRRFDSRERRLLELISDAWRNRLLLAVDSERHAPRTPIWVVTRS